MGLGGHLQALPPELLGPHRTIRAFPQCEGAAPDRHPVRGRHLPHPDAAAATAPDLDPHQTARGRVADRATADGLDIRANLLSARFLVDRFVLNCHENFEPVVRNVKHLGILVRLDSVVLEGEATPGLLNATTVYVLTTDKHTKDMLEGYFPVQGPRMAAKLVPQVFFFFAGSGGLFLSLTLFVAFV